MSKAYEVNVVLLACVLELLFAGTSLERMASGTWRAQSKYCGETLSLFVLGDLR